jgi:hypothetical protein
MRLNTSWIIQKDYETLRVKKREHKWVPLRVHRKCTPRLAICDVTKTEHVSLTMTKSWGSQWSSCRKMLADDSGKHLDICFVQESATSSWLLAQVQYLHLPGFPVSCASWTVFLSYNAALSGILPHPLHFCFTVYHRPSSIPDNARFFFSQHRSDRLWGPPRLLSNGYRG